MLKLAFKLKQFCRTVVEKRFLVIKEDAMTLKANLTAVEIRDSVNVALSYFSLSSSCLFPLLSISAHDPTRAISNLIFLSFGLIFTLSSPVSSSCFNYLPSFFCLSQFLLTPSPDALYSLVTSSSAVFYSPHMLSSFLFYYAHFASFISISDLKLFYSLC